MNTKLFKLHEAYGKHSWKLQTDRPQNCYIAATLKCSCGAVAWMLDGGGTYKLQRSRLPAIRKCWSKPVYDWVVKDTIYEHESF